LGELVTHLFERALLARTKLVETDDVPAEVRLDRIGDVADLCHRIERVLERSLEHAAADPAETAAVGGRTGVVGVLRGERVEILAGANALDERLGAGARLLVGLVRFRRDQDVARGPLLLAAELEAAA